MLKTQTSMTKTPLCILFIKKVPLQQYLLCILIYDFEHCRTFYIFTLIMFSYLQNYYYYQRIIIEDTGVFTTTMAKKERHYQMKMKNFHYTLNLIL